MLKEIDLKYVWHPFTQMHEFRPEEDLIIVAARGNYLYDENGREYYDATSSLWVNVHGHGHGKINAALRRQLGRLDHSTLLGIGNEPAALLAKRLVELANSGGGAVAGAAAAAGKEGGKDPLTIRAHGRPAPDVPSTVDPLARLGESSSDRLTRVFFSDNGSTAVEIALKMAFQYWRHMGARGTQRSKFIALSNGYHGDTIGSVSVGGIELFHSIFSPLLFHTYFAPSPVSKGAIEGMEEILKERGDEIAAMVVEPLVQGAGGMVVYPPEVLRGYERLARKYGVLFIVDEVATGFGRCGAMFASHLAGVRPDLMAVAKGLTGGVLPVAATLVSERVYNAFLGEYSEFKTFFHGHTYTGNPLGCAAALANLELICAPDFLPSVREKSQWLTEKLKTVLEHPHVGDVRLLGLMGGIELVKDKGTGERFPMEQRIGHKVCLKARECGVLARPLGDVLVLMPPLASTIDELEHMVDALMWGLDEVMGTAGASWRSYRLSPRPRKAAPVAGVLREISSIKRFPAPSKVLVTGTDTGVGKTVVTGALAAALGQAGLQVCCAKPVESGVGEPSSQGSPSGTGAVAVPPRWGGSHVDGSYSLAAEDDSAFLARFSTRSVGRIPRWRFTAPLSPHLAARLEGREVQFDELAEALRTLQEDGVLLIEGAGGLLVPITESFTFADLAREAGLAVLIVAPDRLGCLNQTLLTVRTANDMGLDIAGVVLHRLDPSAPDQSTDYNEHELGNLLGDLFVGSVPFLSDPCSRVDLALAAQAVARRIWNQITF